MPSYSHIFCVLHGVSDGLGSLLISNQHLIVTLLHLEVYPRDLILVVLPQLSPVYYQRTVLHHTGYLLLVILELVLFELGLASIPTSLAVAVVGDTVEVDIGVVDALGLLVDMAEDSLDDAVVSAFTTTTEQHLCLLPRLSLLRLLQGTHLFLQS